MPFGNEAARAERKSQRKKGQPKLTDEHLRACKLYLTADMTQQQIATVMDVSRVTVNKWLNLPHVKKHLQEIREKLERNTEEAVLRMYDEVVTELHRLVKEGKNEMARINAAKVLLQVAGLTKHKVEHKHETVTKVIEEYLKSDDEKPVPEVKKEESLVDKMFPDAEKDN